jgi:hypothetical protein
MCVHQAVDHVDVDIGCPFRAASSVHSVASGASRSMSRMVSRVKDINSFRSARSDTEECPRGPSVANRQISGRGRAHASLNFR